MISQSLASLSEGLNIHHHADWVLFDERLKTAIHLGRARRVQSTRKVYASSEEWYIDTVNNELYVYLRPDDKVLPEWNKIDVFEEYSEGNSDRKNINIHGLRAIPTGNMSRAQGEALRIMLDILAKKQIIEVIDIKTFRATEVGPVWVSTFREATTGTVYEFVEYSEGQTYSWHLA